MEETYSSVASVAEFVNDVDFEKQIAAAKDECVERYLKDLRDDEGSAANHPKAL